MSSIVVAGDTSGSVTLSAPAVAGASVLTLPVATDTLVGKATTDTLTNKTLGSGLVAGASLLTSGTVNSGGTNPFPSTLGPAIVDFTGIPSWAKRITVMFSGVSTSGTSNVQIQLGDSGGIETSGYLGGATRIGSASDLTGAFLGTGFELQGNLSASDVRHGCIVITQLSSLTWTALGVVGLSASGNGKTIQVGGAKTLSDVLTQVRIMTVNGTDLFDAGSINIMYE